MVSASQRGVVKMIVNNRTQQSLAWDNATRCPNIQETHNTTHNMATPSHARKPSVNSRPTTPLRPPSRTSLRASQTTPSGPLSSSTDPLACMEPAFAELSDSMADLEANFMHLQLLNESLNRFNECFGGFLYGLNMSAFCVDFPEVYTPSQQFRKTSH